MATIYNIKIKTVSAFSAYTEEQVREIFEKLIKDYKHPKTGLGFESTKIEIDRS